MMHSNYALNAGHNAKILEAITLELRYGSHNWMFHSHSAFPNQTNTRTYVGDMRHISYLHSRNVDQPVLETCTKIYNMSFDPLTRRAIVTELMNLFSE